MQAAVAVGLCVADIIFFFCDSQTVHLGEEIADPVNITYKCRYYADPDGVMDPEKSGKVGLSILRAFGEIA